MDFCDFYSASSIKDIINKDINLNMLNHAYLLCSQDDIYLQYLAKEIAKDIMTNTKKEKVICDKIDKNIHSDVQIYPKGNTLVVEDANEIVEKAYIYPLEGDKKIFILNNFENATVQAQNKLLKTLEEPPVSCVFVITTSNPENILTTIVSRSKKLNVPVLSDEMVERFILKNFDINKKDINSYVVSSMGNLTKAFKIANDPDFLNIKKLCGDIALKLVDSTYVLEYASLMLKYKERLKEVLDELGIVILDILYTKSGLNTYVQNKSLINEYTKSNFSVKSCKLTINKIIDAQNRLNSNCNANVVVDNLLLSMLEVKYKWK